MMFAKLVGETVVLMNECSMQEVMQMGGTQTVERTDVGEFFVSTVFLGVNHGSTRYPKWFETMIFYKGNGKHPFDQNMWRSETFHEAKTQHENAVALCARPLEQTWECEYCGTFFDSEKELTQTKWHGLLCATCMENQVWK